MHRFRLPASAACLLLFSLVVRIPASPQATGTQPPSPTYEIGGAAIAIPIPWTGAVEMGPEKRHFMDQFVPPTNRLIAGFVDAADLTAIHPGDVKAPPRIALVAVSRQFESSSITEAGFKQIIDSVSKGFDATVSIYAKDNEDAFNRRLQELNLDDAKISFAEPVSLGCLFSTPDAAAFGTIVRATASSAGMQKGALTKIISVAYVRAANRVLFAYIYADYQDKTTVLWLRKASQDWASQIVTRNTN